MILKSHVIGNRMKRIFLGVFLLGAVIVLSSTTIAQTGEPSREPILRIETGMHTARINQIGVDAANRYLVTASDDKTVRVWELSSGRPLRTIRVPIGEGKLYAVAISPDGSMIAAGGFTGYEWEKTHSIYLFDRESGRLIRRLGGLPGGVAHLVYSPDGQYLAATLGDKNGVRVFSTVTYALAGEDKAYGDSSYGADFDRAGRLVTTSFDGFIRPYATGVNRSLRQVAKTKAKGGQRPYDVKFSPDGTRVVKVLTDAQATKDEVLDGLDWIRKETTSKDVAMVFFAGHGLNDQNGVYYFLPFNTDLEKLLRTGVPFTDIKNTVQSRAGKTLFFIDTCHSGNVLGGRRGLADDLNGVINELASAENGAVVFAASTGNQYSLEDVKWNNGAFTKALVEGIGGRADYTGKGKITVNMLDLYLSERVKELTGGKQTPTTAKPNTVPDFPIAVKR